MFILNRVNKFLKGTARHHSSKYLSTDKLKIFLKDIYVDDMASGMGTIKKRKAFSKRSKLILSKADLNLKMLVTNNHKLQDRFDSQE